MAAQNEEPGEEDDTRDLPPDPSITREVFLDWRAPRLGSTNPERMTNPVWEWLIRSHSNAYQANERFEGPSPFNSGPGWCFDRFGQSATELPDGRRVLIAGEHEDRYDPDFYIYNDVVVQHPDGGVEIFGYPREAFPPTDFHSATLIGQSILLIGNLGYPDQRKAGTTPVLALDLATFAVSSVTTSGAAPGWIYEHSATCSGDGCSILVRGGMLDPGDGHGLVENIDDFRLPLHDRRWEQLTDRRWPRWHLERLDGQRNHFWEIQMAVWYQSVGWDQHFAEQMEKLVADLGTKLGARPNLDLWPELFRPPVPHEMVAAGEDEPQVTRITVGGVIVRYKVDMDSVSLTVEGQLDLETLKKISGDLVRKLSALENAEFVLKPLGTKQELAERE